MNPHFQGFSLKLLPHLSVEEKPWEEGGYWIRLLGKTLTKDIRNSLSIATFQLKIFNFLN